MFENPRRGKQARNLTTNVPKILGLKSSSEQVFSENWRWVPLARISLPFFIRRSFLSVLISYLLVCLFVCLFFTYNYYLCRVWNVTLCFAVEYLCWPDTYWFLACVFNMRVLVWEMYIVEILCFSLSVLKECGEDLMVFASANDSFQVETVDMSFIFLFHFILNMIFVRCFEASKNFPWKESQPESVHESKNRTSYKEKYWYLIEVFYNELENLWPHAKVSLANLF